MIGIDELSVHLRDCQDDLECIACSSYELGYINGKSKAHDEVRAWDPADHHPSCGCDPCRTGKAVLLATHGQAAVLVEHDPEDPPPELRGRYAAMQDAVRSREHEDLCAEHGQGDAGDCWCPCHSRGGAALN